MLKRLITFDLPPETRDAGLLALRLTVGITLLLKHGLEKVEHFSAMAAHFPNPLHLGAAPSLVIALIGDFVCSILIVFGLATRWAAAWAFLNIFVAWAFVHHFVFFGRAADHGELIVLYLAAMLTLFLTGPGRYSVDATLRSPRP
ncbi:MAG: DoxX family protein [Acidobacteriaceae bacterium]